MFFKSLENEKWRRIYRVSYLVILLFLFILSISSNISVKVNKEYEDFRHIVVYIYKYDSLPSNYVPKSSSDSVDGEDLFLYEPFMNIERLLPTGTSYISAYYNCTKTYVGPQRIVFSSTEVYYTDDHYDSFDKVTRFEIYGFHYFVLSSFWILVVSGGIILWVSIKNGYTTIIVIKNDFASDYKYIKGKTQSTLTSIKKQVSSRKEKNEKEIH